MVPSTTLPAGPRKAAQALSMTASAGFVAA
jgi:hypothetical protein